MESFCKNILSTLAITSILFAVSGGNTALALDTVDKIESIRARGQSSPPFLDSGTKANLMLLIDNSGSMLDMAYKGTDSGTCFDNTYDPTKIPDPENPSKGIDRYTGYFKPESWYVWRDQVATSTVFTAWKNAKEYEANKSIVLDNGVFYVATCKSGTKCTSNGTNLSTDTGVLWRPASGVTTWDAGTTYAAKAFVKHKGQLYWLKIATGSYTSITDPKLDNSKWEPVNFTWQPATGYSANDIVTYDGMVFRAKDTVGASSVFQWDNWQRLDEGYFEEVSVANDSIGSCTDVSYQTPSNDFQISMKDAAGNRITDATTQKPATVTCVAAKGKFLNWASASKFDIEKKILTGGKYYTGQESDTSDNRFVSEHRGCAGTGFVKQVAVKSGALAHQLTLRIRGAIGDTPWIIKDDDRVDTTDNTTRIEVLTVTAKGFDMAKCTAAVTALSKDASGATAKDEIAACMGYDDTSTKAISNAAYINGLIECTQIWDNKSFNVNNLESHCSSVYKTVSPATISRWDPEYLCYGEYDSSYKTVMERTGYFGACWDPTKSGNDKWVTDPASSPATCTQVAAKKFCGQFKIPEVIDPSDKATETLSTYNLPAMLVDSGVMGQLNVERPLAVLKGYIKEIIMPHGVIQDHAAKLRIGAMQINSVGADYECTTSGITKTGIEKFCPSNNDDGASLVAQLDLGSTTGTSGMSHVQEVALAINKVKANTWTPLAEAVYSAIGYMTNRLDMCLNKSADGKCLDWCLNKSADGKCLEWCIKWDKDGKCIKFSTDDPVQSPCQDNHLLIITEGASTADIAATVATFATAHPDGDGDTGTCSGGLLGSSYLDELTGFAYYDKPKDLVSAAYLVAKNKAIALYGSEAKASLNGEIKKGIKTHIVTSGSLRDEGTGECNPVTLMTRAASHGGSSGYISGENPAKLEDGLRSVIESIIERASTGSAASVISSSRTGEGAVYQALFWPQSEWIGSDGSVKSIKWFGDVHALFINDQGQLYEDTPPTVGGTGDGKMETVDLDGDGKFDKRVVFFYDEAAKETKGCYKYDEATKSCASGYSVPLNQINYIFSVNNMLSSTEMSDVDRMENRVPYISGNKGRYIFTWNDLNADGIVDSEILKDPDGNIVKYPEILSFDKNTNWATLSVSGGRGEVPYDFGINTGSDDASKKTANVEVLKIVNWMRGFDQEGLRSRIDEDGTQKLLGDVIHSTPVLVSSPQENFHLLYNDETYARFQARWNKRRHVVYFGANDGMLHAVNAGFYEDRHNRFCLTADCVGTSVDSPKLGVELWAYVPYNLLPHLEFLANPNYVHKYYVDLRPRIFDVQIFSEEDTCKSGYLAAGCIHPNGWGTILVGGMRFGGAPVHAKELNGLSTDQRVFASSYFVLDITNPEEPPKLLGEITRNSEDANFDNILDTTSVSGEDVNGNGKIDGVGTDLGYSTAIPTLVIMKKDEKATSTVGTAENKWYLVLGSGPHAYGITPSDIYGDRALKGYSDQRPKVAVVPLDNLINLIKVPYEVKGSMRISDAEPSATETGRFLLGDSSTKGFVSDLITVDYDINPSSNDYLADAVYFGTVETVKATGDKNDAINDENAGFIYPSDDKHSVWGGGGTLYRLVTRNFKSDTDKYSYYVPASSVAKVKGDYVQKITTPNEWKMTTLMNVDRPITAAPSVASDGNNFWIYFGTGRFFDVADKTDDTQQAYYGLKEPMVPITVDADNIKKFTWESLEMSGAPESSSGEKGLLRVDQILVQNSKTSIEAKLSCIDGSSDCLPIGMTNFQQLEQYIAGIGTCSLLGKTYDNCADGWYKEFYSSSNRERNLGQATILGGLVTFTTYEPYSSLCAPEGLSYLYGVYYKTGTAWYKNIFGTHGLDQAGNVKDLLSLGIGLTLTPNLHSGSGDSDSVKAFIQTSTGEIIEVKQENLPINNFRTGRVKWKEYYCD